jgi:DNA helicase-2/ATP-dependent DNA helicase PcrA
MEKKYKLTRFTNNALDTGSPAPRTFRIDYENLLNPAQYEAVCADQGAYLIIAGAGTGKTRTLVYRLARLIELGNDPQSILLLTFTRKSAKVMLDRASLLLDNRCDKINAGTFHSFANMILRRHAKSVGIETTFTILDQGDSEDVINLIRSQGGYIKDKKRFPQKATLQRIYSLAVNTGRNLSDIVLKEYPHFIGEIEAIREISTAYTTYKKANSLLDYDDLLVHLKDFLLARSPAALHVLQSIKYVMVDEYQDTNHLQSEIVRGLCQLKQNIMVVGDDAQSIYSFRGANYENIMHFPKLFKDVKVIKLEENFRSTPQVLNFANRLYEGAVQRYEKVLFSRRNAGELPMILAAASTELQSQFIIEKILELTESGVPLAEIAVLFRSSFFSFDLEIALSKANIPFQKFGGIKFIETAHIKDILALLRIALNPKDVVCWYRVLLLHEGVGPKTAQRVLDALAEGRISVQMNPESLDGKLINERLFPLFKLIYTLRTKDMSMFDKVELAVEYYQPIFRDKYDDFNKRKKDIDIFLNIASNYRSLEGLLSDMAIEPPLDSVSDLNEEDKQEEYLTLSTIHSAKGLEWHSVFIIHAVDGFFPSTRSAESIDQLEEERRLLYVAATRAKQNLIITYPMHIFDRESGTTLSKPSRFLNDVMVPDLSEQWLLENE